MQLLLHTQIAGCKKHLGKREYIQPLLPSHTLGKSSLLMKVLSIVYEEKLMRKAICRFLPLNLGEYSPPQIHLCISSFQAYLTVGTLEVSNSTSNPV